jgi:hypothetical protein
MTTIVSGGKNSERRIEQSMSQVGTTAHALLPDPQPRAIRVPIISVDDDHLIEPPSEVLRRNFWSAASTTPPLYPYGT